MNAGLHLASLVLCLMAVAGGPATALELSEELAPGPASEASMASLQMATPEAAQDEADAALDEPIKLPADAAEQAGSGTPLLALGVGDAVSVQVYGRPELATTTYVADDGTIPIPLAGRVAVQGLSPAVAAERIATAFQRGEFLVNPQVTVFMVKHGSQQVSVLGAVKAPGRFTLESRTTILDVLAQAGGITEGGADTVLLLRPDATGKIARHSVDLQGLSEGSAGVTPVLLVGGDSIFVPDAKQFYIHGEVNTPNRYRLKPGMTVVQAIALGGGITPRGSSGRIEITRREPDGRQVRVDAELEDPVQNDDVIRVKERLF